MGQPNIFIPGRGTCQRYNWHRAELQYFYSYYGYHYERDLLLIRGAYFYSRSASFGYRPPFNIKREHGEDFAVHVDLPCESVSIQVLVQTVSNDLRLLDLHLDEPISRFIERNKLGAHRLVCGTKQLQPSRCAREYALQSGAQISQLGRLRGGSASFYSDTQDTDALRAPVEHEFVERTRRDKRLFERPKSSLLVCQWNVNSITTHARDDSAK